MACPRSSTRSCAPRPFRPTARRSNAKRARISEPVRHAGGRRMTAIDFRALMEPVARRLWGEPNDDLSKDGELRWGTRGSKSVDVEKGTWFDHEANEGGGTRDLIKRETHLVSDDQIAWLEAEGFLNGATNVGGRRIVAEYDYLDENGVRLFQV